MPTLSLRTRLLFALAASMLAGAATAVVGASDLVSLQQQAIPLGAAEFRHAVWSTLALVALVASATAVLVVVLTTRSLGVEVQQVRSTILSLAADVAPENPGIQTLRPETAVTLRPVVEAVQQARVQVDAMIDQVRMERDRNRAIIDTVFASVFAVDGGGRIIHANAAAARMFDRPMHALTGVVLSDMIAADSLRMSVDECGTVTFAADAHHSCFTTDFRVFGRRAFPAEVSVTPLMLEGQRAWAVFVHDLSARLQAESALHAARITADEANRAKTAFLARIGQDFRTPLEATVSFAQVVLRSRSSQLSERDRNYLERVQGSSTHMLTLVGDILDLAEIECGTLALDPTPTDVTALVQSIVAQFEDTVAGRPVMLTADYPDIPVHASIDARRLRQIVTNLVSNAVKFTARGTITVTICREGEGDRASAVIVRDTGIGIPLDRQSHIFELFAEAPPETVQRYGGSGLGLALSKRLAMEMGCMLSVESMPGAGSSFTLAFAPEIPVTAAPGLGLATLSH